MTKSTKGVVTVVVVFVLAAGVWYITNAGKKAWVKQIIKLNGTSSSYALLLTFDEGYLKAWANSLKKGQQNFTYNNEQYNTQGGKKIVS